MNDPALEPGLHESVLTTGLERALHLHQGELNSIVRSIDNADVPRVLARYVSQQLEAELTQLSTTHERVEFVNAVLATMETVSSDDRVSDTSGPRQLLSIARPPLSPPEPPSTPLSDVALLTNAKGDPQMGPEIKLEMKSADRVDVIMSFVKWSGIRVLEEQLLDLQRRGVHVRVLTTTYMGATEKKALDFLVNKCGAEVHVSYDSKATRLHAKAWIFHRNTGFDTGYIGSSNLSRAAMLDGLEWNVRVSRIQTPTLVEKFEATFESYWQSPIFEPYDPQKDGQRLAAALNENAMGKTPGTLLTSSLDVRPYPHQAIILDDLQHERQVLDIHKNLVVAATGTGKTVIAALDYRRLCQERKGPRPRLLFVAHREEILRQSMRTFRDVLGDGSFGELLIGQERPVKWDYVFASIQSLSRESVYARLEPDHFDVIIIDEFHHGAATSYSRIIEHFTGYQEFLGLTATPERADGQNIVSHYFGGRIASELRLWTALDQDLLVPFHYFGVADGVDVSGVQFTAGGYSTAGLDKLYTGNDARARKILDAADRIVTDVHTMRALGFCVSVDHAEYMAEVFNKAGIPALAVTGQTSSTDRQDAIQKLAAGDINCLMAVDVFNEGFDLPSIDTIFMMRPTQSATIFMQQLGRGLRRTANKSVLTVLDFVGHQHKDFRFDIKLRALTGQDRKQLQRSAEEEFPFLPAGSQIVLDEVVQREVIDNLKSQLDMKIGTFLADVHEHSSEFERLHGLRLKEYLDKTDRDLPAVYKASATRSYRGVKGPNSWTQYEAWANGRTLSASPAEQLLLQRMRNFVHVNDPVRFQGYRRILSASTVTQELIDDPVALMLYYSFWPSGHSGGVQVGLDQLIRSRHVRNEIDQILQVQESRTRSVPAPLSGGLEGRPIQSHATYTREELLAGLGVGSINSEKPGSIREGVKWVPELNTDILLITLKKSAADYSPSTMYQDYALTESLFHWESQSLTRAESPTGQRYINHERDGSNVVLFVRRSKVGDIGTEPYTCLGNARYVSHEGEKPMQIVWELERPMPAALFEIARTAI